MILPSECLARLMPRFAACLLASDPSVAIIILSSILYPYIVRNLPSRTSLSSALRRQSHFPSIVELQSHGSIWMWTVVPGYCCFMEQVNMSAILCDSSMVMEGSTIIWNSTNRCDPDLRVQSL